MAACAAYSPSGLAPGSSSAEAIRQMGQPTDRYPLDGGGQRLEFARGPYGLDTYMLDFDAGDHLLGWQQVLTEKNFFDLKIGMTREEVLRRIGHPGEVTYLPRQQQWLWSYRYQTPFCILWQVGIDKNTDRLADMGNNLDPRCSRDWR